MVVTAEISSPVKFISVFEEWQFFKASLLRKASYVIQVDFLTAADPHADTGGVVYFQCLAQPLSKFTLYCISITHSLVRDRGESDRSRGREEKRRKRKKEEERKRKEIVEEERKEGREGGERCFGS